MFQYGAANLQPATCNLKPSLPPAWVVTRVRARGTHVIAAPNLVRDWQAAAAYEFVAPGVRRV